MTADPRWQLMGRNIHEGSVEWIVIGAPKSCLCGHDHYPRRPHPNARSISTWWGWCEDPDCGCERLHTQYKPREASGGW